MRLNLLLATVVLSLTASAAAQPSLPIVPGSMGRPDPTSLAEVLDAQGRVRAGLQGSYSAQGFSLRYDERGAPRFVPARAMASMWATNFRKNEPKVVRHVAASTSGIYIVGEFERPDVSYSTNRVAQWDGTGWRMLGDLVGSINAISVQGTDVYVAGYFGLNSSCCALYNLARWDGTTWHFLGPSNRATGGVYALAVHGNDVYIGGGFEDYAGIPQADRIARWDGTAWHALSTNANGSIASGYVYALAVVGNIVYAGGTFTDAGGGSLVDYVGMWDGSFWYPLGRRAIEGALNSTVNAIVVEGSNLYVGGSFTNAADIPQADYVARWDGAAWHALGTNLAGTDGAVNGEVKALAVQGTQLYIGGRATNVAGVPQADYVARWDGAAWAALGSDPSGANGALNDAVTTLAVGGSNLYVGGAFTYASGIPHADGAAYWDGAAWHSLVDPGDGLNGNVRTVVVNGTDVYVGGEFTDAGGLPQADYIARWDGAAWHALGSGSGGNAPSSPVYAIALAGSNLYAGGDFGIAQWNGASWSQLGSPSDPNRFTKPARALAVSGSDVYVGGSRSLAQWDGSAWHPLGPIEGDVYALAVYGGALYVGGWFTSAGGVRADGLARWDGSSWRGWRTTESPNFTFVRVLVTHGAELYAAGRISPEGGAPLARVARWDGVAWQHLGEFDDVYALAVQGNSVYVGGNFGGNFTNQNYILRLDNTSTYALGTGVNDNVYAVAVNSSGTQVYAGGAFTNTKDGTTPMYNFGIYRDETVPVELTSFTATADGPHARLAWTTASETNNAGFHVELRSRHDADGSTAWRTVAFLAGHGTTSEQHSYTHTVDGLALGTHAFRLRQVDFDGSASYSPLAEVIITAGGRSLAVGPNPSGGASVIRAVLAQPSASFVTAVLYDGLGRAVVRVYAGEAGAREVLEVPVAGLAPGMYVLRVEVQGQTISRQLVVTL